MTNDLLMELRTRRADIGNEMRARLDEVDRMIALATPKAPPKPRRRWTKTVTVKDIFDPLIVDALLSNPTLTTQEISKVLPGKKLGPVVSGWRSRAKSAGIIFDDLVRRSKSPDGQIAFSLTDEGRRVFGEASVASRM